MANPTGSWDLIVTLLFIAIVAYGTVMQREKIIVTMISAFVGLVIATVWGDAIYEFFNGSRTIFNQIWIRSSASPLMIKSILLAGTIFVLNAKSGLKISESKMGQVELFIYSVITAGLIVSSILFFMPEEQRLAIAGVSRLADKVIMLRNWWVVAPVILMIFAGFKSSSRD